MPGRILIVESETNTRISLKSLLAAEYFDVVCHHDAKAISSSILKFKPDIILIGTLQNSIEGYDLCRQLKLNAHSAHLPIVICASSPQSVDWTKALTNLVDDIRIYPQEKRNLVSRLRHLYRQKVELDTLKTHAHSLQQFGFNDITVETPTTRLKKPKIAFVQSGNIVPELTFKETFCDVNFVPNIDLDHAIDASTDLIILPESALQHRQLAHLDARSATRNIPKMCLIDKPRPNKVNRLYELGANECLPSDCVVDHIQTRAQSLITFENYKKGLRKLLNERVKESCIDPLTGIYNRRHAQRYLTNCFNVGSQENRNLVIMMLDIDKFKSINDTLGHIGGDEILKDLTQRMSKNLRRVDLLARVGGEEFMIVIPDASLDWAHSIAERLRLTIEETPFNLQNGKISQKVTVSIGIAIKTPSHETATDLINSADQALYQAKTKGRNQVRVFAA